MPGAFAHITAVNLATENNALFAMDMPNQAKLILSTHQKYVELGCVSPDYPYLAIGNSAQNKWADLMHYQYTGDVIKVLDPITDRGAKTQSNKTLSILKQMFNFGVERDLIQGNPISTVKKKSVGGLEKSRTRALEFDEVIQVFERLPKLGISQQVIYALKCITLTGCRPIEVTGAQWQEFDFDKMIWTIPAERVKQNKNGERTHKVPITQNMIILLDELRAAFGYLNSKYVFPSTTTNKLGPGEQPIDRHSLSRSISRKLEQLGVPKFVPHDLRRTVATRLGDTDIGTDPIVIEKILNHQLQGVQGVYNMQEYMEKRCKALEDWGNKLW